MNKLKVGIAGYNLIGQLHAEKFRNHPKVGSIIVADPEQRPNDHSVKWVKDYHDLAGCDAVVIALPTNLHLLAVEYFAPKGIAMLIEKPLATDYKEALQIQQVLSQCEVPAMCGLLGLYHPEFRARYDNLQSIGEILSVAENLHEANPGLERFHDETRGVLNINGIHTIHRFYKIASLIAIEEILIPDQIFLSRNHFASYTAEDTAQGLLTLGRNNKVPFSFSMSFRNSHKCDNKKKIDYTTKIDGKNGTILVTGWEKCELLKNGKTTSLFTHDLGPLGNASQYTRIAISLEKEIDEFIRFEHSARNSGNKMHFTLNEAVASHRLLEECYMKAQR